MLKVSYSIQTKAEDARKDRGEAEKQHWGPVSRDSEKVLTSFHYEDQSVPAMNLVSLHLRLESTVLVWAGTMTEGPKIVFDWGGVTPQI